MKFLNNYFTALFSFVIRYLRSFEKEEAPTPSTGEIITTEAFCLSAWQEQRDGDGD